MSGEAGSREDPSLMEDMMMKVAEDEKLLVVKRNQVMFLWKSSCTVSEEIEEELSSRWRSTCQRLETRARSLPGSRTRAGCLEPEQVERRHQMKLGSERTGSKNQ